MSTELLTVSAIEHVTNKVVTSTFDILALMNHNKKGVVVVTNPIVCPAGMGFDNKYIEGITVHPPNKRVKRFVTEQEYLITMKEGGAIGFVQQTWMYGTARREASSVLIKVSSQSTPKTLIYPVFYGDGGRSDLEDLESVKYIDSLKEIDMVYTRISGRFDIVSKDTAFSVSKGSSKFLNYLDISEHCGPLLFTVNTNITDRLQESIVTPKITTNRLTRKRRIIRRK